MVCGGVVCGCFFLFIDSQVVDFFVVFLINLVLSVFVLFVYCVFKRICCLWVVNIVLIVDFYLGLVDVVVQSFISFCLLLVFVMWFVYIFGLFVLVGVVLSMFVRCVCVLLFCGCVCWWVVLCCVGCFIMWLDLFIIVLIFLGVQILFVMILDVFM